MRKLIDADALIEFASNHVGGMVDCNDIARFPTIDVVEMVRCKDCKYYCYGRCVDFQGLYGRPKKDDFCSYGERKEK